MASPGASQLGIRYRLEERPPWPETLLLAFQHLLSAFGGIIAVPIIIGTQARGGAFAGEVPALIGGALLVAGLATLIQTLRIGPIGSGLPQVMGTSFVFVGPGLAAASSLGLGGYFGCTTAAAAVVLVLGFFAHRLRRFFPPLVTGTVVTLIGLSLMPVALLWLGGGAAAKVAQSASQPATFGAPVNLALGLGTLSVILLISRFFKGILASASIFVGLAVGTVAAVLLGRIDPEALSALGGQPWLALPIPFRYGFEVSAAALFPFVIGYVVVVMETTGDTMGVAEAAEVELSPERLRGALLANGVGSLIAGLLNAGPNATFAQNIGVVALSGVASRWVVAATGGILVLLGLAPRLAALIALIPQPVLGGAGIVMFGMVAGAGIRILSRARMDKRALLILSTALAVGMISAFGSQPGAGLFEHLPEAARILCESSISMGAITVIALNLLFPEAKESEERESEESEAEDASPRSPEEGPGSE